MYTLYELASTLGVTIDEVAPLVFAGRHWESGDASRVSHVRAEEIASALGKTL